jgi:uncharacterized membrane protein YdjX (TVP38/TMEM64 family)
MTKAIENLYYAHKRKGTACLEKATQSSFDPNPLGQTMRDLMMRTSVTHGRLMLFMIPFLLITALVAIDAREYFTIRNVRAFQEWLEVYYHEQPLQLLLLYLLVHISSVALAFPSSLVLTLLAGAILGFGLAALVVPLAMTIGATLCFLISRHSLRKLVQKHCGEALAVINKGLRKDGGNYLLALRMVPLLPFVMVNLLMGVTTLPVKKFFLVSYLGILPRTLAYINAGSELSHLKSLDQVLSLRLLLSLALIGVLPMLWKALLPLIRKAAPS